MQQGFTLIETLLYIGVIGAVAVTFVSFSISVSDSSTKGYVAQEVHGNGRMAMDMVSQRMRAATGVNLGTSTFDSDPGLLSLEMAEAGKNPTIISLTADDGTLQIKEGGSSVVAITSSEVQVTNLQFTDLTPTGTRENIRVEMTIGYGNAGGDVEFNYSKSWQTAVSMRQ